MKMNRSTTKRDPNPVAIATMMASEHSILRAVAKWLKKDISRLFMLLIPGLFEKAYLLLVYSEYKEDMFFEVTQNLRHNRISLPI